MNFKTLVENVLEDRDVYTVESLLSYSIWDAYVVRLPDIKKYIKKDGMYKRGARVIVPVFKPDDENEVTLKAKELIAINGTNLIQSIKRLREWSMKNLTEERIKELGYDDKSDRYSFYPLAGLRLGVAKNIIEKDTYGFLIIPAKERGIDGKSPFSTTYVYDMCHALSAHIRSIPYRDFVMRSKRNNIDEYKTFSEYNIDKETEENWGDILSEL